jgi:hypothetical protein
MDRIAGKTTSSHKIAAQMDDGTSPATINRWRKDTHPDANKVVAFSRAYGENPLVALIVAGYITEDDILAFPFATKTNDELLAELKVLHNLHAQGSALAGDLAELVEQEIAKRSEPHPRREPHESPATDVVNSTES